MTTRCNAQRGLTLIELLIAIAIVGVILALATPSFGDYIRLQRLKGVQAELITDLQLARSEAITRNQVMYTRFGANANQTCYVIFTTSDAGRLCDCTRGSGSACGGVVGAVEVRTTTVPRSQGVAVSLPEGQADRLGFDHITGGILRVPLDALPTPYTQYVIEAAIDSSRTLRTTLSSAGRPTVCAVAGTALGAPAC